MSKIRKPTIKIVLRKSKTLANGEHPVSLRITFDRKSKYYSLKADQKSISCSDNKWSHELGRFNRNRELNTYLDNYEHRAEEALKDIDDFTFTLFENKYFRSYDRTNVEQFFDVQIKRLRAEDRLGSANSYKDTRNRLKEYKKGITFNDIDLKFLQGFERYLINKGNSTSTIGIYLRTLRAVYNKAISNDLVRAELYPFKKFKIKTGNPVKKALTKSDMLELMDYKADKGSRRWHSLNYFIFSYLCRGMNMQDMARLKWNENIKGDKIVFIRRKTTNTKTSLDPTVIKIEEPIANILAEYSGNEPYVFPILEEGLSESTKRYRIKSTLKKVSKDLTAIGQELGIPQAEELTMYWARHTYATTLKRSGVATAVISELLGHSDEATTKAYLDKFEQPELDDTFKHLL